MNFQDISITNALLAKNNWTVDSFKVKTKQEICTLLGVNGVISGTLLTGVPFSGGASALLVFTDVLTLGQGGKTNFGKCTINVHEGKAGELLWKYEKKLSGGLGRNYNSVIDAMMRKAAKKFPYENIK